MAVSTKRWLSGTLIFSLVGPANVPARDVNQDPPGVGFETYSAGSVLPGAGGPPGDVAAAPPADEPTGVVGLGDAVAAALLRSPALAGFSLMLRIQEARAVQAGRYPNPEIGVELENVGGSGSRAATEEAETTVWLSQLIPLGGKRGKRRRVAELDRRVAEWDYETARLDVLTEATKAFVLTLKAQEQLTLAHELERIADESVHTAEAQRLAGATSAVESTRAHVVRSQAQLEETGIQHRLAAARAALAATWGSRAPAFSAVRGDLSRLAPPPPLAELERHLDASPDIARWATELERRESTLAVERALRIPDPTVSLGGRYFSDNGDGALVFALSVPLPVFDRNQGEILAAQRDVARARTEHAAAVVSARTTLVGRYEDLAAAFEQSRILQTRTLPAATAAFEGARAAYRKGLYRYLDVLDANRTLYELRTQHLDALTTYHLARADVERLTAMPLPPASSGGGAR